MASHTCVSVTTFLLCGSSNNLPAGRDTTEVNSLLYGKIKGLVSQDEAFRWPLVTPTAQADVVSDSTPVAPNGRRFTHFPSICTTRSLSITRTLSRTGGRLFAKVAGVGGTPGCAQSRPQKVHRTYLWQMVNGQRKKRKSFSCALGRVPRRYARH